MDEAQAVPDAEEFSDEDDEGVSVKATRPIGGKIKFTCPRCGAPHIMRIDEHGVHLEIDEERTP